VYLLQGEKCSKMENILLVYFRGVKLFKKKIKITISHPFKNTNGTLSISINNKITTKRRNGNNKMRCVKNYTFIGLYYRGNVSQLLI
jgi:hypothetical protein